MRTIRRFYFYIIALISLEVVIWGSITLARTLFDSSTLAGIGSEIARGIALVLVGLPIFLLHWLVIQREALRDEEERASRLRALFLYAALAAVLIPCVQNILAILNRPLITLFHAAPNLALIGSGQTLPDNLAAIALNLTALAYFWRVLRSDWQAGLPGGELVDVRRLYRFVWVIYGLGLLVVGVQQLTAYILSLPGGIGTGGAQTLANGLALTLVGAPLWTWTWRVAQRALETDEERSSLLRLVILYLLALLGAVVTLISLGRTSSSLLEAALNGGTLSLPQLLDDNLNALSLALPFGVIWAYFSRQLGRDLVSLADPQREAGLARLYRAALALMGLVGTYVGGQYIAGALVDLWIGEPTGVSSLAAPLSSGLAALLVSLPVWLGNWPRLQREARQSGESGETARRSLVRKGYLYLVLFAAVAGTMTAAGWLFYRVFNALLQGAGPGFWLDFAHALQIFLLASVWLVYHLAALRADARQAQRSLSDRQANFPVLILQVDEEPFGAELLQTLQRQAPRMPVILHRLDLHALEDSLAAARVVVLPAGLVAHPPEALRLWLNEYTGQRLVVPLPEESWVWLGAPQRSTRELARSAALAVRQLAEGQPARPPAGGNPWVVVGYVLAGLFSLELLFVVLGSILSGLD